MLDVTKLQPLSIFYEIELGRLKKIYHYPQYPLDLTVEHDAETGTGQVSFSLFDETGFTVEANLWLAASQPIHATIRWGYHTNTGEEISSIKYQLRLLNYQVTIGKNYFTYTVTAIIDGSYIFQSSSYTGTLLEIIDQFADQYGYKVKYNPEISKEYLRTIDPSGETTLLKDAIFTKTADMPDGHWVSNLVRTYARDANGVSGYNVIFDFDNTGQKIMRIELPDKANIIGKIIVQDKNSNVIDWQPEINIDLSTGFGSKEVITNAIEEVTGNFSKLVFNYRNSDEYIPKVGGNSDIEIGGIKPLEWDTVYNKNSELMSPVITNKGIRIRKGLTSNGYVDLNPLLQVLSKEKLAHTISANLILLGNPTIKVGDRIEIDFKYPSSIRLTMSGGLPPTHYSSGIYHIKKIETNIAIGSYTTTLRLRRERVVSLPGVQ